MTHPSHAHFPLFGEEGLPSGMFLSGGRLTTFLDSELASAVFNRNCPLHLSVFPSSCARLLKVSKQMDELKSIFLLVCKAGQPFFCSGVEVIKVGFSDY